MSLSKTTPFDTTKLVDEDTFASSYVRICFFFYIFLLEETFIIDVCFGY